MTKEERAEKKRIVQSLGAAFEVLPEAKREFLIGYAEGVAAMKSKLEEQKEVSERMALEREMQSMRNATAN